MHYETINEALIACVKACGGSKTVGPLLWPEKHAEAAQRLILDCLNEERPAKLSPEQVFFCPPLGSAKRISRRDELCVRRCRVCRAIPH